MKAVCSVSNLSWIVIWNGTVQDVRGRRFWDTKDELMHDLKQNGLRIAAGNKIVACEDRIKNIEGSRKYWKRKNIEQTGLEPVDLGSKRV